MAVQHYEILKAIELYTLNGQNHMVCRLYHNKTVMLQNKQTNKNKPHPKAKSLKKLGPAGWGDRRVNTELERQSD